MEKALAVPLAVAGAGALLIAGELFVVSRGFGVTARLLPGLALPAALLLAGAGLATRSRLIVALGAACVAASGWVAMGGSMMLGWMGFGASSLLAVALLAGGACALVGAMLSSPRARQGLLLLGFILAAAAVAPYSFYGLAFGVAGWLLFAFVLLHAAGFAALAWSGQASG